MSAERIWVGGYTEDMNGMADGIGLFAVAADGSLVDRGTAAVTDSPSFLAADPLTQVLYAAGEGVPSVSAFHLHGDELHFSGTQDAAGGLPCALSVVRGTGGRVLAVACYADGTIDVHPLGDDGSIAKTSQTLHGEGRGPRINQEGPHAHAVLQLASGQVLTTDLGADRVHVHEFDGELLLRVASIELPAGTGPRDLVQHPAGPVLLLTELSHEIYVLDGDPLAVVGSIALPGAEENDNCAAISFGPGARFFYAASRGSDTVGVVEVSADGRALRAVGSVASGGGWPRHLVVDGDLLRVANQLTNSIVTFTLGADGLPVHHSAVASPSPTYLLPL